MDRKYAISVLAAFAAVLAAQSANAQTASPSKPAAAASEEIVITAQRREENLQTVPIAVTALSSQNLKDRRIETGAQLINAVPNMTFQPGAFGKPDFVVRGIGYQLVTSTGEAGVAVHDNDAPLTISRVAQSDFFDLARIEVLRGPQGTLYGRNATGGVINVITQKPTQDLSSSFTAEVGDYNAWRGQGYVNLPIGDALALRIAGDMYKRDGFMVNQFNGNHVNDVDRWAGRATLSFRPNDRFSSYLMYEHFNQDGGNGNGGNVRDVCLHDPGPTSIGGVTVTDPLVQAFESQGCAAASVYNPAVMTGVVNGIGDFGNRFALGASIASGDLLANNTRSADPYSVSFDLDPYGKSKNDLYQFEFQQRVTDDLNLIALATYSDDNVKNGAGGNRALIPFNFGLAPDDPQLPFGPTAFWTNGTYNSLQTKEGSVEVRLQSSFDGPFNFSVGANYVHLTRRDDVFVYDNINYLIGTSFLPVDPSGPTDANGGHYYFQSVNPYKLISNAVFGEVYWTPRDDLKITAGVRYTDDKKTFYNNTSAGNLLLPTGGDSLGPPAFAACASPAFCPFGYTFATPQFVEFREPTGRLNVDWKVTPNSSLYATYSRGYKGGGFNPPNLISGGSYAPEFVNAYEVGSKNQFFDRKLTLNLTGFYYDYKGYQFTQADSLGTHTGNLDARIWGAELETIWRPIPKLEFNAQIGYLNTKILNGASADPNDPTAGNPAFSFMKTLFGGCVVSTANFANLVTDIQNGTNTHATQPITYVPQASDLANLIVAGGDNLCADLGPGGRHEASDYGLFAGVPSDQTGGITQALSGNQLPNDPAWTVAAGAQYTFDLGPDWTLTPRVDTHYQASTYADVFNSSNYRTKAYHTENASLTLSDTALGFNVQAFVKNIADRHDIVGVAPGGGAILGNPVAIIVSDPRTIGVSVTKKF